MKSARTRAFHVHHRMRAEGDDGSPLHCRREAPSRTRPPSTDWGGRFIRGRSSSAGAPSSGGSATHTHAASHDHQGTTATEHTHVISGGTNYSPSAGSNRTDGLGNDTVTRRFHKHDVTSITPASHAHDVVPADPTVSSESRVPEYREFALCEQDL